MQFSEKENRRTASVTVAHGLVIYQLGRSTGQESPAKADKSLLSSIHTSLLHFLVSLKFKQRCRSSQRRKMLLSSICTRFRLGCSETLQKHPEWEGFSCRSRSSMETPLLSSECSGRQESAGFARSCKAAAARKVWDQLPLKGVDIRNQKQMKRLMEEIPTQHTPQLCCNPSSLPRDELSFSFYPDR